MSNKLKICIILSCIIIFSTVHFFNVFFEYQSNEIFEFLSKKNNVDDSNDNNSFSTFSSGTSSKIEKEYINRTIGIIPFPNSKFYVLKNSSGLTYHSLPFKYSLRILKPSYGYYQGFFHFYYNNTVENQYSFENYKEDMLLNNEIFKYYTQELNKYDYIFIPTIGMKIDDDFNEKLSDFVDLIDQYRKELCFGKIFMDIETRKFFELENSDWFIPKWESKISKDIEGIIFPPSLLESLYILNGHIHFLNRIDVLFQHYCEIENKKVFIPKKNLIDRTQKVLMEKY